MVTDRKDIGVFAKIFSVIIFITIITVFFYAYFKHSREEKLLTQYGKETTCLIVNKYKKLNGKTYVKYEFSVNNNHFYGIKRYNRTDDINIGEKFKVIFYPDNPEINKILLEQETR